MTPELEALARRAVACPRWRWMPGMLVTSMGRIIEVDGDLVSAFEHPWIDGQFEFRKLDSDCAYVPALPDLTDFATLGCLLALVREAWGDPGFYAARSGTKIKGTNTFGWDTFGYLHGKSYKGMLYRSEAEALVAALETGGGGV